MNKLAYVRVFNACRKVCLQAGYPIDREMEYRSAVNWAIFKAFCSNRWEPGLLPISPAIIYALKKCEAVEQMFEKWRKQDECGALRGKAKPIKPPIPTPDIELLKFVARYGRKESATLLNIGRSNLRARLDAIALRIA